MIIRQIEVGVMDNFTYLVGCEKTRQALIIDPGADEDRIADEARKENLTIVLIVNTHGHGDHTAGNGRLKSLTGAEVLIHALDADGYPHADRFISDEGPLQVGEIVFNIIHTPGHTPGGVCLYTLGHLFTGDTLFVGDSGRTDLAGADRSKLGASLRRLMTMPDDTVVWPGHDYGPMPSSTIGWEKRNNINAKAYGYYVASP